MYIYVSVCMCEYTRWVAYNLRHQCERELTCACFRPRCGKMAEELLSLKWNNHQAHFVDILTFLREQVMWRHLLNTCLSSGCVVLHLNLGVTSAL